MSTRRVVISIGAMAGAVSLILGCASPGASGGDGDTRDVTFLVTQAAWSPSYAPLAAAVELGYFADENLDVRYVNFPGGVDTATQLEQGQGDVAIVAPESIFVGHAQGTFESQYYALLMRRSHFDVATVPGGSVRSAEDLEGAKVGVVALSSSGVQIAQAVAAEAGVDPGTITFVEIGAGPQAVAAVSGGAVDALSLFDSQYQIMRNNGLDVEVIPSDLVQSLNAGGLLALPGRLAQDPDYYAAIARAVFKAVQFCDLAPEACIRMLWEFDPATRSSTLPEEEALANDVSVFTARSDGSYVRAPGETEWGSFPDGTWETFEQYMRESDQLTGEVDLSAISTDTLLPAINDFDPAEVERDAQAAG